MSISGSVSQLVSAQKQNKAIQGLVRLNMAQYDPVRFSKGQ